MAVNKTSADLSDLRSRCLLTVEGESTSFTWEQLGNIVVDWDGEGLVVSLCQNQRGLNLECRQIFR